MTQYKRNKLVEVSGKLAKVAMGSAYADVVIKNGTLVNVYSGELIPHMDVAVAEGRVAFVGNADHTIGDQTVVINAAGKYIAPGFLDGHMHVESTMLSVTEFAKAALPKGTTGIFMDPHEIANVFGSEGVKLMHEEGQQLPLKVFTTFPSCVPATTDLEDAGASLEVKDIEEGLQWDNVVGLGEVMNFPGVVYGDPKMCGEIEATINSGKAVTGHFPSEDDRMLQAYIASGVTSDHETVTREQGLHKVRMGMHLMIREGSAWHDVKEVIKVVTEDKVNTSNISLVTDDVSPQTLVEKGHLNHVVRRAIEEGVDPVTAIQMVTINVARYFNLEKDLGSITPGKCADILLLADLQKVEPVTVMTDGNIIFDQGQIVADFPTYVYPLHIRSSMNVKRELTAQDFQLASRGNDERTSVNVIQVIENSARTAKMTATLNVEDGIIQPDIQQDVVRLACIERHRGTGEISLGFTSGFQLKSGAVASTVAHDSHNLIVMGIDEQDMALAANELVKLGGGTIVVENGRVLAQVPLTIAGLMSDKSLLEVVDEVAGLEKAWKQIGCPLNAPFMTFSLIALPVIPEIRISNRGLVNVTQFKLIDVELV
ncbi:adenine deaminase [Paenibacillus chondroitinus]|uniref:Adenine deaminase n=1 Tax=Paenibacillus chondroitinus TaxID=59842 RepID=A0ABU6DB35_9BACL|nr:MULTISPECIES: adenine deaminase [Paenibacillus]MCY9663309.1 adenine deaminase [Paenibacillus anseongense]MEB4794944.1 adenine deaminase [Paenibacillus chondroitinus]